MCERSISEQCIFKNQCFHKDCDYREKNVRVQRQCTGMSDKEHGDMFVINRGLVGNTSIKSPECVKSSNGYTCYDSRLVNPMRGSDPLEINNPTFTSSPNNLYDIYDPSFGNYKYNYKSYEDVDGGNIIYNFIPRKRQVFSQPVFSSTSSVTSYNYIDPMDSIKPSYIRNPVVSSDRTRMKLPERSGYLSWIEDSNEHREDIISRQMSKMNQRKFEPLY